MLKFFKKSATVSQGWCRTWSCDGIMLENSDGRKKNETIIEPVLVSGFLTQLLDDGLAIESGSGFLLGWDELYMARAQACYDEFIAALALPPVTQLQIGLSSRNALTDTDFSIAIHGWRDAGTPVLDCKSTGAMIYHADGVEIMQPQQWQLVKEVVTFSQRTKAQRDDNTHRQSWGRIRRLALTANAYFDDFLHRSVVLTPEKLEISLRRSEHVGSDRVIEIEPGFPDAPADWLEQFDRSPEVKNRYDISTATGIIQVLISPKVKTVLQEIKRLPGRRVAGSRAQAFLLNPYAALGDDANDVIAEEQFEQARESAGLQYERFVPIIERDVSGYPLRVGLLIETANFSGPVESLMHWLDDEALNTLIQKLSSALLAGYQLVAWQGYDLEIQGDTGLHYEALKIAFEARKVPQTLISYSQVHDLGSYCARIEGIGIEEPFFSPYIAKKNENDSWFPENVMPVVVYQPENGEEAMPIPVSPAALTELREALATARAADEEMVQVAWLPKPLHVDEADRITQVFDQVFYDVAQGTFATPKLDVAKSGQAEQKKQLILRANIQQLDYEEARRTALEAVPSEPEIPKSIQPTYSLLEHQRSGLAWMQHMYQLQETHQVRGVILADDMGLGKTFQLLALMAWVLERQPDIEPMLVVAPVALLENWADEANKFFLRDALPILTAYGANLRALRVQRAQIDPQLLAEDSLVKFLKPNWIGSAKIVLTTYETLRDLEFSFATQRWSVMVCDEAQRIKNPAAMVTRATKKQNVGFKIACTGTPVENTLADIWCLFDFVQPGLLGALNDFGKRYRRPIEAKSDEEHARVEELRRRIAPQILRRMKSDVIKNLPNKVIMDACRRLPLSAVQRTLYAKAVEGFKRRDVVDSIKPFKNHLGLLQYLRLICTDPRPYGLPMHKPEPAKIYREKAPKLDWLLRQLAIIKSNDEKVIVFCEFREIQRLLKHYIDAEFDVTVEIINGDTTALAGSNASRQKRIKAFQAKPGFGVIILSPLAVGFGVNIQAANHVVHYTRTWNPAKEDQATDRAYRIGQEKDVYVYYPVVCADDFITFDVKLDQLLTAKRCLAEDMLNGSGDLGCADFDFGEVVAEVENGR